MADTAGRFDLTRIRLLQYKSIQSCDLRPGRLTLLVGPNGAGKSNVLDALRLTAEALNTSLDQALRERGGVAEVQRRSDGSATAFRVDLEFAGDGGTGRYAFDVASPDGVDFLVTREVCEVTPVDGDPVFYRIDGHRSDSSPSLGPVPRRLGDRLYLVSASGIPQFRPVFDGLRGMQVFNLNPQVMRQPQRPASGEQLRRDGSNAASVLAHLAQHAPETKALVEQYLRGIVDDVDGVDSETISTWDSLAFRQHVDGAEQPWRFPATSMSDGTLRALGVLLAVFAGSGSPVGVEEPETALHPAAAALLMDALRDAAEHRQVFVTSHSPDLLDVPGLRADELLAVRSVRGTTVVGPPDAAGALALKENLYRPGDLLRTDQLQPEPPRSTS